MNEIVWDRKTITKPGTYANVPIETYHGDTKLLDGFSISSSGIRQVDDRPSAYWIHSPYNPKRVEKKASEALNFGKAAHHLLLGEAGFAEHFAIRPDTYPDRKTGEPKPWNMNADHCKAWVAEQYAAGRIVLSNADIDVIRAMRDSLAAHPIVRAGALNGRVERSMFAKVGGIWLRARPDVIPQHDGAFVDLKTSAAVDDDSLARTIFDRGYHVQGAVVRMVCRELKLPFESFVLAFLEKTAPFEVRFKEVQTQDLDLGERQARAAIRIARECLRRNVWPGYDGFYPSVLNIQLPEWARTRAEKVVAMKEAA